MQTSKGLIITASMGVWPDLPHSVEFFNTSVFYNLMEVFFDFEHNLILMKMFFKKPYSVCCVLRAYLCTTSIHG